MRWLYFHGSVSCSFVLNRPVWISEIRGPLSLRFSFKHACLQMVLPEAGTSRANGIRDTPRNLGIDVQKNTF